MLASQPVSAKGGTGRRPSSGSIFPRQEEGEETTRRCKNCTFRACRKCVTTLSVAFQEHSDFKGRRDEAAN